MESILLTYFSVRREIRQGENLHTEILDKGYFTELKYNKVTMQKKEGTTMESGSSGNIPGRSSQTMVCA